MANDRTDALLQEIVRLVTEEPAERSKATLLYARIDRNFVSLAVFDEREDDIVYREPHLQRLSALLLDFWEATRSPRPWREIEYLVRGDATDVSFTYREQIDPDEMSLDRRDRIVAKHFGDKPIVYTPLLGLLRAPDV